MLKVILVDDEYYFRQLLRQTVAWAAFGFDVIGEASNGKDALELILAGATAVSVGTANFANPMVTMEIVDGIEQYMQMHGVADINELIGAVK